VIKSISCCIKYYFINGVEWRLPVCLSHFCYNIQNTPVINMKTSKGSIQRIERLIFSDECLHGFSAYISTAVRHFCLSLGVKRSGREADHLPPSSAEVKNAWRYTSIPPICFH
jgi:hypothetical protein